jgi:NitT/TauT family transport system ATP-binding protein
MLQLINLRKGSIVLEISNLSVAFEPATNKDDQVFQVLHNLSFSMKEKEFLCILGPSGCGKTTLLRVIIGLLLKQSGTIKVAGQEKYSPGKDVCLVFQSYGLFPWQTVNQNVQFGLKIQGVPEKKRQELAKHYIDLAGLEGFENHYPHQISGGMQQRVGLARALACKPNLLLMDEPFAAVDFQTRERLQDELLRIYEQTDSTVVFVTHSIEEAVYLGTRVIVMSRAPSQVKEDIQINLGDKRWDRDVRLEHTYEDYVIMARRALQTTSEV